LTSADPAMFPHVPPDKENPADQFNRIVAQGGGRAELDAADDQIAPR
jgi:hypothetical protein